MQFVFSEHTTPLNQHRGFNLTMDGSWATVVPAASDALPRPSTAASAAGSGGVASGAFQMWSHGGAMNLGWHDFMIFH